MSDTPRSELHAQIRAAEDEGHPLSWEFGFKMADMIVDQAEQLAELQAEVGPLREFISDVDEFFDGAEGDLFLKGHKDCLTTRRVADFRRSFWLPSAQQRGFQRQRGRTWGRGRG